ncbi:MAG: copper chaperone PCu(A)C [Oceanospirillaceae bacterium]|jgi:copper(I)-binding protein|uniref:copper chaperone PCu(A)C n=1 Tax=Marinobacterium litorale TaxID=404770 RepID=UPI000420697C|nr:copper chaperone PCu(A)C [Marinobacterium litorale]MBT00202.1 copper chaperone PCu(A)C [Oceanospirillaceae bacterium]
MKQLPLLLAALLSSTAVLAADVTIKEPYARAVPPGQPNSAIFLEIENRGNAIQLVGAESSAAQVVELHTHTQENGVMRMRRIDAIELPANTQVTLQPGGLHIMLIGLQQGLSEGEEIDLKLQFSDGDSAELTLPIRSVMAGMKMQQKHAQ